ncbi:MAG: translation initiation factor IF-2 N-terminal domain-containing protein, partial [Rhodobacteraceae bacterium]|nr:translation initiation factor IF-2 N-terminal domain-containing protein [Paracoccaceae bacterium]
MSDTDGKKPLGLGGGRSGQVKQSFSHGRTKNVVVETKRKRIVVPKPGGAPSGPGGTPTLGDPSRRPAGISDAEMERRLKALQAAKAREAEETVRRAEEERQREEERERRRADAEAKEREEREREEALRLKAEEEARRTEEAEARAARKEDFKKPAAAKPAPVDQAAVQAAASRAETKGVPVGGPRKTDRERDDRGAGGDRDRGAKRGDEGRRAGKLTLSEALDEGGRQRSLAAMKRKQEKARAKALGMGHKAEKQVRDVQLPEMIVVQELANRMAERAADVVKALMKMGMMVTMNQSIDADTAELVIEEFGHHAVRVTDADVEQAIDTVDDRDEDLRQRPPIITIMGHVD